MNILFEVFLSVFASFGFIVAVWETVKLFGFRKKTEITVFLPSGFNDDITSDKWDVKISSPEEERILKSLTNEFTKIYIIHGDENWTTKKKR